MTHTENCIEQKKLTLKVIPFHEDLVGLDLDEVEEDKRPLILRLESLCVLEKVQEEKRQVWL